MGAGVTGLAGQDVQCRAGTAKELEKGVVRIQDLQMVERTVQQIKQK